MSLSKQEQLNQAIKEIDDKRKRVFDLIDEAAYDAATHTIASMQYVATDQLALANRKNQDDAADRILDMAGYHIKRVDLTGAPEIKITVEDYGANSSQNRASA